LNATRLAALRTSAKAQIHAVMAKLGILPTMSDMFGPTGQGLLDEMLFEGAYAIRVTHCAVCSSATNANWSWSNTTNG
jgi:hypothetical protein